MKAYVIAVWLLGLSDCGTLKKQNVMMSSDRNIAAYVRLTIDAQRMILDLTVENMHPVDVYIPDVAFRSTPEGPKINRDALPVVINKNNDLEAALYVQPLDPNTQWSSPPTFYTRIIRARSRYQRQWILPYPVRIASRDNYGMGREVPTSNSFILNLGIVLPTSGYSVKAIDMDGETLYSFGQDALRFQTRYALAEQNKAIRIQVVD